MVDKDPITNLGGMLGLLDPSGNMVPLTFTGGSGFSSGSIYSSMGIEPKYYTIDSAASAIDTSAMADFIPSKMTDQEIEFQKSLEFYDSLINDE